MSTTESAVSFESDIKPLFRERDRESMMRVAQFDLWSYDDVRAKEQSISEALESGKMPCDGAWPADRVELFKRWAETGMAP
jgi:hypothetical protein